MKTAHLGVAVADLPGLRGSVASVPTLFPGASPAAPRTPAPALDSGRPRPAGGGGAEGVSERQAREAIQRGDHIAIESTGSLLVLAGVKFEQPPHMPGTPFRIQMAYRQAGLFVAFLHDTNPTSFAQMMDGILDGRPLAEAVVTGYGTDLPALWSRFASAKED